MPLFSKRCRYCREPIGQRRLEAIPETNTCLLCSRVAPVKGVMTWEHKTAPFINIVTQEQYEEFHRLDRRGVHANVPLGTGSKRDTSISVGHSDNSNVQELYHDSFHAEITHPRARCHPDRLKATSDGKCLECAQNWYRARLSV